MSIKFLIRKKEVLLEDDNIRLKVALEELDLSPEAYLAMRDGVMIDEDTILQNGDRVTLIPAISGG